MTSTHKDPLGSAWIIVAAVLFTVMGILVKYAVQHFAMNSYELVFWRVLFAVIFLAPQAACTQKSFYTPRPMQHIWRGLAGTGGLLFYFYGIAHLPLATAITINTTSPLFLAILSLVLFREPPTRLIWFALITGLLGIIVLLQPTLDSGQIGHAIITLGGGVCSAYAYLKVRELSRAGEPAWRVVLYFSAVAAVVSAIPTTYFGWRGINGDNWLVLLGIGLSAMLAQLAMTRAYHVGRTFTVSALSYLNIVFGALYGMWFLHETAGWADWLGIAMIIGSGVISSLPMQKKS